MMRLDNSLQPKLPTKTQNTVPHDLPHMHHTYRVSVYNANSNNKDIRHLKIHMVPSNKNQNLTPRRQLALHHGLLQRMSVHHSVMARLRHYVAPLQFLISEVEVVGVALAFWILDWAAQSLVLSLLLLM